MCKFVRLSHQQHDHRRASAIDQVAGVANTWGYGG